MSCVFCEIFNKRIAPGGFEKHFFWILDIHPVSPGHMLIIPKRHISKLSELTVEEEANLRDARNQAIKFLELGPWQRLEGVYRNMVKSPETANSRWFAERALNHGSFGTKPDGYNFVVNEGLAAGQTVHHLHLHIIPRYKGDVSDPRGGGRYVIPGMGDYISHRGV